MANKRQIKKQIHYACSALATQCIIAGENVKGIDRSAMCDVILEIGKLQVLSLERCSFSFDKTTADFETLHLYNAAKAKYYSEAFHMLVKEFNERVAEILHKMNSLLPAEQREANKAAAK